MAYKILYKRSFKIKCFMLVIIFLSVYFAFTYIILGIATDKPIIKDKQTNNIENIIVHIDFKGSPVKLSYLKTLLPQLKSLGVTGLLMEYEDMFPYEGGLVNLSARNCYSKTELKEFLTHAASYFDIIPLIQTFGHMEHVLKLSEFQRLREIPLHPDSVCPSKLESLTLISTMLGQVISFHANIQPIKYVHIGCDEVFHINKCQECKDRALSNVEIYLNHVEKITNIVNKFAPNAAVLIWDDMFREIPMNLWQTIKNDGIEPVYWDYGPSLMVSHVNMMKYHQKFRNIWIASAFKGADGRTSSFPNLLKRFHNNYSWSKFIANYKFGGENEAYDFKGIILTGWSRYSHMDPPCDLIQVSIPSLYLNLLLIQWFTTITSEEVINSDPNEIFGSHISKKLVKALNCTDTINLDYFDEEKCKYDGNKLYNALKKCDSKTIDIMNYINDVEVGLFAVDFYSKSKYINMNQAKLNKDWCNIVLDELLIEENNLRAQLARYYDRHFIEEYVNFKLSHVKNMLFNLIRTLDKIYTVKHWKRRP